MHIFPNLSHCKNALLFSRFLYELNSFWIVSLLLRCKFVCLFASMFSNVFVNMYVYVSVYNCMVGWKNSKNNVKLQRTCICNQFFYTFIFNFYEFSFFFLIRTQELVEYSMALYINFKHTYYEESIKHTHSIVSVFFCTSICVQNVV